MNPALHESYEQPALLHPGPTLLVVSHAMPQPVQLVTVFKRVSHATVFGGVVTQSPQPASQPEYVHDPATHDVGVAWTVSHATPHAPQLVTVLVGPQPASTGAASGPASIAAPS